MRKYIDYVETRVSSVESPFQDKIRINRSSTDRMTQHSHWYKLTEKNYWRAVGMQLRLAGFVKPPEIKYSFRQTYGVINPDYPVHLSGES